MIRRPPRSTLDRSSAASDVYKRQVQLWLGEIFQQVAQDVVLLLLVTQLVAVEADVLELSLIHISEPTRPY